MANLIFLEYFLDNPSAQQSAEIQYPAVAIEQAFYHFLISAPLAQLQRVNRTLSRPSFKIITKTNVCNLLRLPLAVADILFFGKQDDETFDRKALANLQDFLITCISKLKATRENVDAIITPEFAAKEVTNSKVGDPGQLRAEYSGWAKDAQFDSLNGMDELRGDALTIAIRTAIFDHALKKQVHPEADETDFKSRLKTIWESLRSEDISAQEKFQRFILGAIALEYPEQADDYVGILLNPELNINKRPIELIGIMDEISENINVDLKVIVRALRYTHNTTIHEKLFSKLDLFFILSANKGMTRNDLRNIWESLRSEDISAQEKFQRFILGAIALEYPKDEVGTIEGLLNIGQMPEALKQVLHKIYTIIDLPLAFAVPYLTGKQKCGTLFKKLDRIFAFDIAHADVALEHPELNWELTFDARKQKIKAKLNGMSILLKKLPYAVLEANLPFDLSLSRDISLNDYSNKIITSKFKDNNSFVRDSLRKLAIALSKHGESPLLSLQNLIQALRAPEKNLNWWKRVAKDIGVEIITPQ